MMKQGLQSSILSSCATKYLLSLVLALFALPCSAFAQPRPDRPSAEPLERVHLTGMNARILADELLAAGFDILEVTITNVIERVVE